LSDPMLLLPPDPLVARSCRSAGGGVRRILPRCGCGSQSGPGERPRPTGGREPAADRVPEPLQFVLGPQSRRRPNAGQASSAAVGMRGHLRRPRGPRLDGHLHTTTLTAPLAARAKRDSRSGRADVSQDQLSAFAAMIPHAEMSARKQPIRWARHPQYSAPGKGELLATWAWRTRRPARRSSAVSGAELRVPKFAGAECHAAEPAQDSPHCVTAICPCAHEFRSRGGPGWLARSRLAQPYSLGRFVFTRPLRWPRGGRRPLTA
jgi:hypothetical protein